MAGENGGGGGTGDDTGASSPKNKIKFLCSHGGKILPRPGDGMLKYAGGETRVIAVHRDINFSELMKKLTALTDGDMVLKYQLVPEDLDALVSVRSDADLLHMFDEHDRHVNEGAPMLRAFLFPSKPVVLENQSSSASEPHVSEQRYIDAINGIIHINPRGRPCSIRVVSSACSSPKKSDSPEGHFADVTHESFFHDNQRSMHKVRSSPSFSSLNNLQSSHSSPKKYEHSCYHHYQHHPHGHPPFVGLSSDPQVGFGFGIPPPILPLPRQDNGRSNGFNQYYSLTRNSSHKGSSGFPKTIGGYHDESSSASGHFRFERSNSDPRTPSPRQTIWE